MSEIKVVVIDDSAFMRKAISTMLEKDSSIKVVATARNGQEGLDKIKRYQPDVVTLDIEMPVMDGLTALKHIMADMPRPVLMVSSLTTEGAESTLRAMELGAVDFIPKQLSKVSLDIVKIEADLREKVKYIGRRKFVPRTQQFRAKVKAAAAQKKDGEAAAPRRELVTPSGTQLRDVVAIGVSTGGPPAVQNVLSRLPATFSASILIAQHMPPAFTGPFAKRLDGVCKIHVKEAEDGERMLPGTAYVAPGGKHLVLEQKVSRIDLRVTTTPEDALYKPSANVLISSVAQGVGKRGLGVILTGMGSDGKEGIAELKQRGGRVVAQDEKSCVVYGMPKAVVDARLADEIVDIEEVAGAIVEGLYK